MSNTVTGVAVEWTFRGGDIVVVAAFLLTVIINSVRVGRFSMKVDHMEQKFAVIDKRFEAMEQYQASITEVLRTIAVQKVQIEHLENDIKELRHGDGFIGVDVVRRGGKA